MGSVQDFLGPRTCRRGISALDEPMPDWDNQYKGDWRYNEPIRGTSGSDSQRE